MSLGRVGVCIAVCLVGVVASARAADAPRKPNIVFILVDDMGYGDIQPFGSTKSQTPNLNQMTAEGMKLTSFYCAPVCSISRAQSMTGCYGQRISILGVFGPDSKHGISDKEHTVAQLLKKQGYATMCIGKWHLGDQPEFFPTRHGFDHYFGLPYSNDMMQKSSELGKPVVPLIRDEKVVQLLTGDDQRHLVSWYTDEAIKFITENHDHPFFLYLPHTAVHMPIHPGPAFEGKSGNGPYYDWVNEVDWSTGQILDTLKKLKLDDNTLVFFTSDNGPYLLKGNEQGTAGPLRGGKGSTWEGGMRESTIVRWPGKIAPGTVSDAVAGNIDLLPTFVAVAGGTIPTDNKIDGVDLGPLLFGKTKESPRKVEYFYNGAQLEAVREGSWKLAIAPQGKGLGQPKGDPKVPASLDKPRLYNLDTDIGEVTDVAEQHPDVVKQLRAVAEKMAGDLGLKSPGPGVRPSGLVDHPNMLYPTDKASF